MLCGIQSDYLGRKTTIMVTQVISFSGILCILLSTNMTLLYVGNLLAGYSNAIFIGLVPVYTGEISQARIRKATGSFMSMMFFVGFAVTYSIGSLASWKTTASIIMVWPLYAFVLLFFCPESPTWLINKGRNDLAVKTLISLRGDEGVAMKEIGRIEHNLKRQNLEMFHHSVHLKDQLKIITKGTFVRPSVVVTVLLAIGWQWGGYSMELYTVEIVEGLDIPISPYWVSSGIGYYQLIGSLLGVGLSSVLPRRKYYIGSGICIFIGAAILGTKIHLQKYSLFVEVSNTYPVIKWIPVIGLLIFFSGYSTGYIAVSFMLMGELLPSNARGTGIFIVMQLTNISGFLMIKYEPFMQKQLGLDGLFWLMSCVSLFSIVFAYFCVPETYGKTLEEIEEHYRNICYPKGELEKRALKSPGS